MKGIKNLLLRGETVASIAELLELSIEEVTNVKLQIDHKNA